MPDEITIRLGGRGEHVTVDLLIRTLERTVAMLRELEPKVSVSGEPLRWEVLRASKESPLTVTLAPEVDPEEKQNGKVKRGQKVVDAYMQGMRTIQRSPTMPPFFDESLLIQTKEMIEEVAKEHGRITFLAPDQESVEPTPEMAANLERVVAKVTRSYTDTTTIEGTLDTISVHKERFVIVWEVFTRNRIKCLIAETHIEDAKRLLGRRVAVTGRVAYKSGKPSSMRIETIRRLREVSELPQPADIGPLDITGGLSPEEYIRRMRDGR